MHSQLQDQKRLIEERKRQVLERASPKIDSEASSSSSSRGTTDANDGPKPNLLVNDGNFLARFKAMQEEAKLKKENEEKNKNPGKFTINLSGVKKKTVKQETSTLPKPSAFFEAQEDSTAEEDDILKAADELALKVAKGGDEAEAIARMQYKNDTKYRFLFDESHPAHEKYKNFLKGYKSKNTSTENEAQNKRKRKNRWDEAAPSTSTEQQGPQPGSSSASDSTDIMAEFQRAKLLIQQKAAEARAKSGVLPVDVERQKQIETQQEIEAMYRRIIAEQAIKAKVMAKQSKDQPKYEYDSDEDTEGGTWEHRKRKKEMDKTYSNSLSLTDQGKGKHHMGDFLPPEELAKFQEKVKAIKEGRKADLSDYAEFKIKEENIGYKMLQQAGWQEGKGLGAEGKGITEPINKGATSFDHSGVGLEKPSEVEKHDDEFDIYRKRMMLAYKFRPNPLNNPRRPYY